MAMDSRIFSAVVCMKGACNDVLRYYLHYHQWSLGWKRIILLLSTRSDLRFEKGILFTTTKLQLGNTDTHVPSYCDIVVHRCNDVESCPKLGNVICSPRQVLLGQISDKDRHLLDLLHTTKDSS